MRIAVLSNSRIAIPSIVGLHDVALLAGLATPDLDNPANAFVADFAATHDIPLLRVDRDALAEALPVWLETTQADAVIVITFPYKIPSEVLDVPRFGFLNFHGGLLPRYRGGDPAFWEIKNQEPFGGISVHRMDASFDTGPLIHVERVPIEPTDTYGLHASALSSAAVRALVAVVEMLMREHLESVPQDASQAAYQPRPGFDDIAIQWATQPARAVDALVRACNPLYGGAATWYRELGVRIYQTTVVEDHAIGGSEDPGTVIAADDDYGLIVRCADGLALRIDIAATDDGVFTGRTFVRLGNVEPGDSFTDDL